MKVTRFRVSYRAADGRTCYGPWRAAISAPKNFAWLNYDPRRALHVEFDNGQRCTVRTKPPKPKPKLGEIIEEYKPPNGPPVFQAHLRSHA